MFLLKYKILLYREWENYGLRKVIRDKSYHKASRLIISKNTMKIPQQVISDSFQILQSYTVQISRAS